MERYSYLEVGFALDISSINENRDTSMNHDTLADFTHDTLRSSGYLEIWHPSTNFEEFQEESGSSRQLWIDPTSTYSYLYGLTGTVHGDLLAVEFWSQLTDFSADSWENIRAKIKASLKHSFLLDEHYEFVSSPQSFYVGNLCVNNSDMLTVENLKFAISNMRSINSKSKSAGNFLDFYLTELAIIDRLPDFVTGHIWAQLLSSCTWETVQKIIHQDSSLFVDDSFEWQPLSVGSREYFGDFAIHWFRKIRRSLVFTPWPWIGMTEDYDPDDSGIYQSQVARMISRVEPSPEERVAAFAILFFLISDPQDDDIYVSGRLQEIRENWIRDDLHGFLSDNEGLIRECFSAMPEEWKDENTNFLPLWTESEGVLAGITDDSASDQPMQLNFSSSLISRVDARWPEFMSIESSF